MLDQVYVEKELKFYLGKIFGALWGLHVCGRKQ